MALGTASKDIIIKIKGDNSNFNTALKKTDASMKGFAGKMKQHSGAIKAGLAGIGIVAAAAFTMAVKSTISYGIEVDKVRKITGMTAETITSLAYAAEQEHTSIESLQTGWRRLSKAMSDADDGLLESKRTFDTLGISIYDNEGQLKSMEVMTLEIAEAFKGMENDTKKAAMAQELFGRSGSEMIPFLEMGADKIRTLQEEAESLGIVMSDEMVDNSKKFGDQMTLMTSALKGVAVSISTDLLPPLIEFSDWVIEMIDKGWLKRLTASLGLMANLIKFYVDGIGRLFKIADAGMKFVTGDFEGAKAEADELVADMGSSFDDMLQNLDTMVHGPLTTQKSLLSDINDINVDNGDLLNDQIEGQKELNELYKQSIGFRQTKKGITSSDWASRAADIAAGNISQASAPVSYETFQGKIESLAPSYTSSGQAVNIDITTGDIVNQGDLDYFTNRIKAAVIAGGG